MRFSFFSALVLVGTTSSLVSMAHAQTALESLPVAIQNEIGRICSPVQFRQGAAAYRNCVRSEIDTRANQTASPMGGLSFDDKYAVQQACARAGSESTSEFQQCVNNEIAGLNKEPKPEIDALNEDEQYAVQQACFSAQSTEGAVAYRRCVNKQVGELKSLPTVSLASLTLLERNSLQLKCAETTSSAADYRRCLAIATNVVLPPKGAIAVASTPTTSITSASSEPSEPTTKPAANNSSTSSSSTPKANATALPRSISPPGKELAAVGQSAQSATSENAATSVASPVADASVRAEQVSEPAEDSARKTSAEQIKTTKAEQNTVIAVSDDVLAVSDGTDITTPGTMEKIQLLWQQSADWFTALPGPGKALLAALVAVPLALLALLAGRRRRQDELYESDYASVPYDGPSLKNRVRAQLEDFDADDSQFEGNSFADDSSALDELFEKHEGRQTAKNSNADLTQPTKVADHHADLKPAPSMESFDDQVTRIATKNDPDNHRPGDEPSNSNFNHWLLAQPQELRRQHCIEFLIYWIAYGDERYDPALKARLFNASELDAHDTIKRWVLKEDVFAFADTVVWIREHCDLYERGECLRLFMALLIPENGLTPVQNTLLRFLSDAFGLGNSLDELYQEAYGSVIPPIPRVDKIAWWEKRSLEEIDLWDSRLVATWPSIAQFRARLGVAAEFNETDVVQAFRRASRRCHPDNFQHLGEREQQLATRAYEKYEEARDHLLGVEV